jgi:hypothetical protein
VGPCLTWAHVAIAGLATDVAGAVALGIAFATKKPEAIRAEVPKVLGGSALFAPEIVNVSFPQQLAYSMVRQRAEARLGLVLLVSGFVLQAAGSFFNLGSLTTAGQRWAGLILAAGLWLLAFAAWRVYVPWDERRNIERMEAL